MSFPGKVVAVLALAGVALAAWQLRQVALLLFGGVLFAVVLSMAAHRLRRWTRMSYRAAVIALVLLGSAVLVAGAWFAGGRIAGQVAELSSRLPQAAEAARAWLADSPLGSQALQLWDEAALHLSWARVAGAAGFTLGLVGNTLLVTVSGMFLALDPPLYRNGSLRLLPPARRAPVAQAFQECGDALAGWLRGQAIAMLFVGVATWAGLAWIGVPLAGLLGVVAGLLDFIPFVGPIVSGLLAVLLALGEGPHAALWVAVLALAIQQVEGNLLVPVLQRHAVQLPPLVTVLAVVVAGTLFGLSAILFATPLAVVTMVLVRRLYVEDWLEPS